MIQSSQAARALEEVDAILIVGPHPQSLESVEFVHERERRLEPKVIGVEIADYSTGGEIVARAKTTSQTAIG